MLITGSLTHEECLIYVNKFKLHGCFGKPFGVYKFMAVVEKSLGA